MFSRRSKEEQSARLLLLRSRDWRNLTAEDLQPKETSYSQGRRRPNVHWGCPVCHTFDWGDRFHPAMQDYCEVCSSQGKSVQLRRINIDASNVVTLS